MMKRSDINYPAVRAFWRVLAPHFEEIYKSERADYPIDYGEFTGGHYDDIRDRVERRVARFVAARFDLTTHDLIHQSYAAAYLEEEQMIRTAIARVNRRLTDTRLVDTLAGAIVAFAERLEGSDGGDVRHLH